LIESRHTHLALLGDGRYVGPLPIVLLRLGIRVLTRDFEALLVAVSAALSELNDVEEENLCELARRMSRAKWRRKENA